jgi:hypothetical protein
LRGQLNAIQTKHSDLLADLMGTGLSLHSLSAPPDIAAGRHPAALVRPVRKPRWRRG